MRYTQTKASIKILTAARLFAGMLALVIIAAGCSNLFHPSSKSQANLFAVDSKNGKVYEIDVETFTAASTPLVSIGQNSAGEIVFHGNIGYVTVGNFGNTAPGLYYFDASSPMPVVKMAGSVKTSAQYLCIVSPTKGYLTAADFSTVYENAVYVFNPSEPQAGLGTKVTGFSAGFFPQDISYASGKVYVADHFNGRVHRLNEAGTAVEASFSTTAGGTTGLLPGRFAGEDGVFVANTGGFDAFWNSLPGSIDFIPAGATDGSTALQVIAGISVGRMAAFNAVTLAATGYLNTYIVDISGGAAICTEISSEGSSFGSIDVNVYEGYAYIPDGATTIYRFSSMGSDVQAMDIGQTGEFISYIGTRE